MAINFDQNRDGITPTSGILSISSTGSLSVPVGNTSQRPQTYKPGQIRFNTSTQLLEWADGTAWKSLSGDHIKNQSKTTYILTQPTAGLVVPGTTEEVLYFVSNSVERMNITETGNLLANFGAGTSVLCGARMKHLSGKTILLTEKNQETGELISHWENIYPSLNG